MAENEIKKAITLHDVKVLIDGSIVGRVQKVSVKTTVTIIKLWEAGNKGLPVDMVHTKTDINGSFDRIFVDKALLQQLAPLDGTQMPTFDLECQTDQLPDRSFLIKTCMLKGFPLDFDLEAESKQTLEFEALSFEWL